MGPTRKARIAFNRRIRFHVIFTGIGQVSGMTDLLSALTSSLRRRVEAEIRVDETLLWAGMPDWRRAMLPVLPLFVFGIGWCAIVLPFAGIAWAGALVGPEASGGAPRGLMMVFAVFSLPFLAVGIGLLGSPLQAALKAMASAHVVTSRRLLTVTGWPFAGVESRDAANVKMLTRRQRPNGSGSLKITFGFRRDSDGDETETAQWWAGLGDVAAAEDAVRSAARAGGVAV
jgi:hypothetical protein